MTHPLPSDDQFLRLNYWLAVLQLHNLRQRMMRVGQIGSVFAIDSNEG